MRVGAIIALSLLCFGCAAGGAIDYLRSEYGSAEKDGTVNIGTEEDPQIYQVWVHKTKSKLNVQTTAATAANVGFAQGATFGAVDAAPVQPTFEKAAMRWFEDQGKPYCKILNPKKIYSVVWEFDYDCIQVSKPQPKKRNLR